MTELKRLDAGCNLPGSWQSYFGAPVATPLSLSTMPDYTDSNIDRLLVERFAHGNGAVFAGAGVSLASQLPSWRNLLEPLRGALGDEASQSDPLEIAELYEVRHGRTALIQHLVDQLGASKYQMNKVHELLVALPVQRIYTTNFDDFLERASRKRLDNRQVIYLASQVGLSDMSKLSIVKLHGDLADPTSIVITERDFYSYTARNPAVSNLLQVELQTHTVLFIGYSFNDPNLSMILGNAAAQSGATAPARYAIQFKPSRLKIDALKARGITAIPLEAEPGTAEAQASLEKWLHDFSGQIHNVERRKQTRSAHRMPGDDPRRARARRTKKTPAVERLRTGLSSEYPVIVVTGEEGVGKTHIVEDAARTKLRAGNRALWIDGFEQVIWIHRIARKNGSHHTLGRIQRSIISQVDVGFPADHIGPDHLGIKIAGILRERRLLVVVEDLDDPRMGLAEPLENTPEEVANDFDKIKAWLEDIGSKLPGRSRIIVTSRAASLSGFLMNVPRMEPHNAIQMIREDAGALNITRLIMPRTVQEELFSLTLGNPQAIRLALGLVNGCGNTAVLQQAKNALLDKKPDTIRPVLEVLLGLIRNELKDKPDALGVANTIAAFPSDEWVPAALLGKSNDRVALRTCIKFGLLDHDGFDDRYFMHRTIKEMSSVLMTQDGAALDQCRNDLADQLIDFLKQGDRVCRPEIRANYWKSLVRDDMVKIDRYWPIIESMMYWIESRPRIVEFVLLLAHYMDSRFLNNLRVHFIKKALEALEKVSDERSDDRSYVMSDDERRKLRALLNIDALGWTYMEEGSKDQALGHISKGLAELVVQAPGKTLEAPDLHALACAWQARILANEGKKEEARCRIEQARDFAKSCSEQPWIGMRVAMIDGDVHLLADETRGASKSYLEAEAQEEMNGGEIGYQIEPRVGLALLREAERLTGTAQKDALDMAMQRFTLLAENPHVTTGRLYGQYGLALLKAREPSSRDSLERLQHILKDITARQGEHNVLLKLAREAYERQVNPREAARPAGRPGPAQKS